MLWTFLLAAAAYGIFIAAVHLLIRPKPGRETEIERFSAIYSNCGFMGIPLASAILGNEGVFYTTAFLSVFFCFAWTHGIMLLTGQHDRKALLKKLCSPTMIGIVIGLLLFFFRIPLPDLLGKTFGYVASMNTPMAMVASGISVAQVSMFHMDLYQQTGALLDLFDFKKLIFFVLAFAAIKKFKLHPIVYIACAAVIGIVLAF